MFGFHRYGPVACVVEGHPIRDRFIPSGGQTSLQIPSQFCLRIERAAYSKVECFDAVEAFKIQNADVQIDGLIDIESLTRRIGTWPCWICDERHLVYAGIGVGVNGVGKGTDVCGDSGYAEIPQHALSSDAILTELDGLSDAKLIIGLRLHSRNDGGIAHHDIELEVAHYRAEQFTVTVFRHTDAYHIGSRCGGEPRDLSSFGIDLKIRVGGDRIQRAEPTAPRNWGEGRCRLRLRRRIVS